MTPSLRDPWTSSKLRENFSVWFCRRGRRWCWRERSGSEFRTGAGDDTTEGAFHKSRFTAWNTIRAELARRVACPVAPVAPLAAAT